MLRCSDRTLLFSVRSDDVPASDRAKTMDTGWTELWLCPVSCDRTRPVVAPEVLDLSGVNRTLGGSVRSLPPERPVNRKHAGSGLLLRFLFYSVEGHRKIESPVDLRPYPPLAYADITKQTLATPP